MNSTNINRIKVWPLLDDFSSALIPYQLHKVDLSKAVYIDFANVKKISSAGLTIITAKLIKLITEHSDTIWIPYFGDDEFHNSVIKDFIEKIGLMNIFDDEIINKDLFSEKSKAKIISYKNNELHQKSFPIYRIKNASCDDRNNVEDLITWIDSKLGCLLDKTTFGIEIFARMIREMAKNSYDHTDKDAFFGMDITEGVNNSYNLKFSFFDLGEGIHKNIKKHCELIGEKDTEKYGLTSTYLKAFSKGLSSGNNKHNRGIGMSIIHECSSILNFGLCIFDARSMAVLPPKLTHRTLRDCFFDTGLQVGFGYYGNINIIN